MYNPRNKENLKYYNTKCKNNTESVKFLAELY